MDCLVVGAGVVGLSIAYQLAVEGKRVTVIDAGEIGQGASWAGAGILPPATLQSAFDPLDQLRGLSHLLHPQWAKALLAETGIDNGFRCCGGWYLARSAAENATLAAQKLVWEEQGIEFRRETAAALMQDEPALEALARTGTVLGAWLLPGECQLRNPRHLRALQIACQQRGVVFHSHCQAGEVIKDGASRIAAIDSPQGRLEGGQYCFTSGAWTRMQLEKLGLTSGIMPIRGQMLLFHTGEPRLRRVISEGHRYMVPRDDGHLLIGSTEEEVGYVIENTEEVTADLRQWGESILPELNQLPLLRQWAGLRPGSFDGLPYIGPIPGLENGFVAAGHFRSGLHMSCATAVVMADLMAGRVPAIDVRAWRVGRG